MDEDQGQGREGLAQEERSPEEVRAEIEETRQELGDTVAAVAEKADVKAQAKQRVADTKQRVVTKKDELVSKARERSPDGATAGAQQVGAKAQENPLPFAVGGALLAGFLLGRLTSRR